MQTGIGNAIKRGLYTKYPGVRWRKDSQKWRVQFGYEGKQISAGSYATELEAAEAHDAYVREHGLKRPVHFARAGELSSQCASVQPKSANS